MFYFATFSFENIYKTVRDRQSHVLIKTREYQIMVQIKLKKYIVHGFGLKAVPKQVHIITLLFVRYCIWLLQKKHAQVAPSYLQLKLDFNFLEAGVPRNVPISSCPRRGCRLRHGVSRSEG